MIEGGEKLKLEGAVDIRKIVAYVNYYMERPHELPVDLSNPLRKAAFFGAIFNKLPTYTEIDLRTHENSPLPEVNELFKLRTAYKSTFGDLTGNRTPI